MSIFDKNMTADLVKAVEEEYGKFFPDNKKAQFVQKSREAWDELATDLNARHAGSKVTGQQCKDKYKNVKKEVKKDYVAGKKHRGGTGGGPAEEQEGDPAKAAIKESVINTFKGTAAFSGVPGGLSTDLFGGSPSLEEFADKKVGEFSGNLAKLELGEGDKKEDIDLLSPVGKKPRIALTTPKIEGFVDVKDLQKQVLEAELKNSRAMASVITKASDFFDSAKPILKKVGDYLDRSAGFHYGGIDVPQVPHGEFQMEEEKKDFLEEEKQEFHNF